MDHTEPGNGTPDPSARPAGGRDQLERIRDILLGSHKRDMDRGHDALRQLLGQEVADLRADYRRRLDALEAHVRNEVASLVERVKGEQSARLDGLQELARQAEDRAKALDARLARLDEHQDGRFHEVRQQLLEHSGGLHDEIGQVQRALATAVENVRSSIADTHLERSTLARVLASAAMMLNGDDSPASASEE